MQTNVRVGIFVTLGLVLASLSVFVIGENRRIWDAQVVYDAAFSDVAGLKPGSPVRMGGLDIGTVTAVEHSRDPSDSKIYVRLTIVRKEAVRIRQGTIAKVANKGLLGDKLVELSIAPAESPALDPGARLASEEMTDLNKYLAKFEAIAQKTEQVVSNMDTATKGLADPQLAADIKATVASIRLLLDGVAHHQSVAHRLLMDDQDGQKVQAILNEAAGAATELRGAVGDVRAMTKQVRDGQGLAHTVLYDEGMGRSAAEVVGELGRAMKAVREGQGVAHSVIYGDETPSRALANLDAVTQDVRDMVAQMRAGKGTLGGLLMDPSVYEDIKSLVGNMNRNQVLRALVRYSIKTEEARAKGAAAEP